MSWLGDKLIFSLIVHSFQCASKSFWWIPHAVGL